MDDDSVDSETENRLVINTVDSFKDPFNKDPTIMSGSILNCPMSGTLDGSPKRDHFPHSSSPKQIMEPFSFSHEETTGESQNSDDNAMDPQPLHSSASRTESSAVTDVTMEATPTVVFGLSPTAISPREPDYQPEEGELEEGELEDEDDIADVDQLQEQAKEPPSIESPPKERPKLNEKDGSKKRSREKDDDKRRKRHRHHKDDESKSRKKFLKEEKNQDFDALLKQELYLRGEASTPEIYQKEEDGESGETLSGEEWDKSGRMRRKKKRSSRSKSKSPSRKNEAICMFFLQGNCQKGNSCPYSHEMAPTRKLELCKFYMVDRCAKREKCLYMHKDFPCKYYHFGMKCVAGEDCKFSHNTLQEPAKNILCKHIESAPKDILGDFPRLAKTMAMNVLILTLDKRKNIESSEEILQSVLEVEGKGFKYVDKALKEYRKRNGIEKIDKPDDKERMTKDLEEKSQKKAASKHKGDNKNHDRKSGRDRGKQRDKNRETNNRDEHRNRPRGRDRRERPDRHRNRSEPNRGHNNPYVIGGTQRQRDFFQRIDNINQQTHEDDMPQQDVDQRDASFEQQTKWYSSDEENEQIDDGQGFFSPSGKRKRGENALLPSNLEICQTPDLKNIDFNYIQQLLNKVKPPNSVPLENYDNSSYGNTRGCEVKGNTEDFSTELKEVFEPSTGSRNLTLDLQNLIKTAREKSAVSEENPMRDEYSSHVSSDPRKLYQESRQLSQDPRQLFQDLRQLSQDPRQLPQDHRQMSQNPRQISQDPRQLSHDGRQISQDSRSPSHFCEHQTNVNIPPLMPDTRFSRENSGNWKSEQHSSLVDHGRQLESYSGDFDDSGPKIDLDLRSVENMSISRQVSDSSDASVEQPTGSMYDIDLRQLGNINSAEMGDINSFIFKMPTHTPAKEINGSVNANPPLYYQLIEVTVNKPDFSNLRSIQSDQRYFDDPRLRLMFKRNSSEEQSLCSPMKISRKDSTEYASAPEGPGGDPKESRDPRKQPVRDPRTEGKLMKAATEPRVDPRMATRTSHSRDPRMDTHEIEENPNLAGPMFINGHMDNAMPNFNNIGPMQNPYPHMDPRGGPGLLGAAPNHGIHLSMQGAMGPGMHRPPYLLATPQMAPINFGRDREDVMMNHSGGMHKGQVWEAGSSYNNPRAHRDVRHTY